MQITLEADYALRMMLELASCREGDCLRATELGNMLHVPQRFALKILEKLRQHGLVHSQRGKYGGFMLGKSKSDITVLEIVQAIDGMPAISRCVTNPAECNRNATGYCAMHRLFKGIQNQVVDSLSAATLSSLLEPCVGEK
nr:Rrf2 family transcriptional regulator [bacterium]